MNMAKKGKKTGIQRKDVIAKALSTKAARRNLAESMAEPIKRSLKYQAIGRKIINVRKMP